MPEVSDAQLLSQLNGLADAAGDKSTQIDPVPPAAPTLDQQLETAPVPRTVKAAPRAQDLDKVHGKAAGGNGYKVWVKGEYYAKSAETKGNVIKKYRLPFILPNLVNAKGEAALGVIVGKLLKSALHKLDPLAVTFRTHEIDGVETLGGAPEPTSIAYMNFDALKDYVRKHIPDFPVDPDEYISVEHLREDVIDFKTNATSEVVMDPGTLSEKKVQGGFGVKKTPTDRILERHAARKDDAELAKLNEGLEVAS